VVHCWELASDRRQEGRAHPPQTRTWCRKERAEKPAHNHSSNSVSRFSWKLIRGPATTSVAVWPSLYDTTGTAPMHEEDRGAGGICRTPSVCGARSNSHVVVRSGGEYGRVGTLRSVVQWRWRSSGQAPGKRSPGAEPGHAECMSDWAATSSGISKGADHMRARLTRERHGRSSPSLGASALTCDPPTRARSCSSSSPRAAPKRRLLINRSTNARSLSDKSTSLPWASRSRCCW
jgi:hypothetical protein